MRKQKRVTEKNGIVYHNFAAEAASMERAASQLDEFSYWAITGMFNAGEAWKKAAAASRSDGECYADRRVRFIRLWLTRHDRADLANKLN